MHSISSRAAHLLGRSLFVGALLCTVVISPLAAHGVEASPAVVIAAPAVAPQPVAAVRQIATYYYYWYDSTTGAHLQEQDGMRYHPPASPAPSWRNVAWHAQQLSDMAYAGIDIVLPVYWGHDKPSDAWSWQGLPILVQAWQQRQANGQASPKIGMFLDTTIVDWRDLTTPAGHDWLYQQFHDYFSLIPRRAWALVHGQPVIYLFTSDWTTAVNQATFDDVSQRFAAEFGVRPYIVREVSWDQPILGWQNGQRVRNMTSPIVTAANYLWGAAMHGYVNMGSVAAVGPGYDDHLVPGRGQGTVTARNNGNFYAQAFLEAIASNKPLLTIETWNEFHEGSSIAETTEYGRQYLDLTRQLAAAFHAWKP